MEHALRWISCKEKRPKSARRPRGPKLNEGSDIHSASPPPYAASNARGIRSSATRTSAVRRGFAAFGMLLSVGAAVGVGVGNVFDEGVGLGVGVADICGGSENPTGGSIDGGAAGGRGARRGISCSGCESTGEDEGGGAARGTGSGGACKCFGDTDGGGVEDDIWVGMESVKFRHVLRLLPLVLVFSLQVSPGPQRTSVHGLTADSPARLKPAPQASPTRA